MLKHALVVMSEIRMQVSDFLKLTDARVAGAESCALAVECRNTDWQKAQAGDLCSALLDLPPHVQTTVFSAMLASSPVNELLASLPYMLHLPLVSALVKAESHASASANSAQPAGHVLQLVAPAQGELPKRGGVAASLTADACSALCVQIPWLPSLSGVNLNGQQLGDAVPQLLQALRCQTQLTCLNLESVRLGRFGSRALAGALCSWPHMRDLRFHCIDAKSANPVMQQLVHMPALQLLQLYQCPCEGLPSVLTTLTSLRHFNARYTELPAGIGAALAHLPHLTFLALAESEDGDLAAAMQVMPELHTLIVGGEGMLIQLPFSRTTRLEHLALPHIWYDASIDAVAAGYSFLAVADHLSAPIPVPEAGHTCGLRSLAALKRLTYLEFGTLATSGALFMQHLGRTVAALQCLQTLDLAVTIDATMGASAYQRFMSAAWAQLPQLQQLKCILLPSAIQMHPSTSGMSKLQSLDVLLHGQHEVLSSAQTFADFVTSLTGLTSLTVEWEDSDDHPLTCRLLLERVRSLQSLCKMHLKWPMVQRAALLFQLGASLSCLTELSVEEARVSNVSGAPFPVGQRLKRLVWDISSPAANAFVDRGLHALEGVARLETLHMSGLTATSGHVDQLVAAMQSMHSRLKQVLVGGVADEGATQRILAFNEKHKGVRNIIIDRERRRVLGSMS